MPPEVERGVAFIRREQARRGAPVVALPGWHGDLDSALGVFPGMHLAWVFTGLTGLAALGLVGLMAYAKELEAEPARRRSRREAVEDPRRRRTRHGRLPGRLGR